VALSANDRMATSRIYPYQVYGATPDTG